jgi:pilus assembly protein Flp/PilA
MFLKRIAIAHVYFDPIRSTRKEVDGMCCRKHGIRSYQMSKLVARFVKDESGATAIEYGLIAALIAVAIILGAGALGTAINKKFTDIETAVKNAG